MTELLTAAQLAEKLHVSVYTVRRESNKGKLPHITIGSKRLYILEEVIDATRSDHGTQEE